MNILQNAVIHVIPAIDSGFENIQGSYEKHVLGNTKPVYACNDIVADFKEVGNEIMSVGNKGKDFTTAMAFKQMLLENKFDAVLNLEGGGSGILYPKTDDSKKIFPMFAESMLKDMKYNAQCPLVNTDEMMIIDYIYNEYNTPMFVHKLSCCKYPHVSLLPYIWRDHLKSIMSFLSLVRTGVRGYVKDAVANTAMTNATVKIFGLNKLYDVSSTLAYYKIMLPAGHYKVLVSCHEYETQVFEVEVREGMMLDRNVMLKKVGSGVGTVVPVEPVKTIEPEKTIVPPQGPEEKKQPSVFQGIRGFVIDESNHPIAEAEVRLDKSNLTVKSNESGNYSLALEIGRYAVRILANTGLLAV